MLREIHIHVQMLVVDFLFKGNENLPGALFQVEVNLLVLGNTLFFLQLADVQHAAYQTAQPLGLVGDDVQVMIPPLRGNGAVQNPIHISGDGGHGGLQLMGHVGHELLPAVFAFLQGGGHVVEGQGQLLHFLGVVLLHPDPGFQIAVGKGVGGLGHIPQGLGLPPGKGHHRQHGDQHHKNGGGEEDVGNPAQGLGGHPGGIGHNHQSLVHVLADDGEGDNIALLGVKPINQAHGGVGAVVVYLFQVFPVQLQSLMLTARQSVGAQNDISILITDHRIGVGYLGHHVQIQQKILIGQISACNVSRRQIGNHPGILNQVGNGGILQKFLHLKLKGCPQDGQGQQQDGSRRGKIAAERTFHPPVTSNL